MDQRLRRRNRLGIVIAGAALSGCRPGFQATVDWDDGTSLTVGTKFDERIGLGPAQSPNLGVNSSGLAFCSANYTALAGRQLAFNIVGTDPSLGANTTTVPTALVPLKFVFPNPSNSTLDGTNVVPVTQNWPIFLTADYTAGSADIGVARYGDAIQRAEFWNLPGFSQNYRVLLGTPTIAATITINVPSGRSNAFRLRNGGIRESWTTTFSTRFSSPCLPHCERTSHFHHR